MAIIASERPSHICAVGGTDIPKRGQVDAQIQNLMKKAEMAIQTKRLRDHGVSEEIRYILSTD